MPRYTRRNLIKVGSAGLLSVVRTPAATGELLAGSTPATSPIEVRVTAGRTRFAPAPSLKWRPQAAPSVDSISVDPGIGFQDILGFGAAFTDASCYTLNQLSPVARGELFHELFHPSQLCLSVCRLCMGSSDYSTKVYSYDEGGADPELSRFSIDHDREYTIPALKLARSVNPGLFFLASPWSPPAWMKVNGSMLGGLMQKKHFPVYAKYFVKFLQAYEEAGIKVNAVSIQNEVDTEQDGRMPASLWGQEYETGFVSEHLGPQLAEKKIDTKIWVIDHNYNLWGRAISELDDPRVNQYVDGVAWHGYLGEPSAMTRVHQAHPGKHMYWTEGGPSFKAPDYQTDWTQWGATFADVVGNWARCIIGWNLALDENGKPNIGPFDCGGLVTINSKTKEITRSGQYWAFAHYARAARSGARRIASNGTIEGVSHAAFTNPGGRKAIVLTNRGSGKQVLLRVSGQEAEVMLPPNSISNLSWE